MKKIMLALVVMVMVQGCTKEMPELKSPCVGSEGSPCDTRPVNKSVS